MKNITKILSSVLASMLLFSGCASSVKTSEFEPISFNGVTVVKHDDAYIFDKLPVIPKTERDGWYMKSAADEIETEITPVTTGYITVEGVTAEKTGIVEYNGDYYYYDADKKQVLTGVLCVEGDNSYSDSYGTYLLNRTYYCADDKGVLRTGEYLYEDDILNLGIPVYDIIHFSINEAGEIEESLSELNYLLNLMSSNFYMHAISDEEIPTLFKNTLKEKSAEYHYIVYSNTDYYFDSHNIMCPAAMDRSYGKNEDGEVLELEAFIANYKEKDNYAAIPENILDDVVLGKIQENTKEWYLINKDGSKVHKLTSEEKADLGNAISASALKTMMNTVYALYVDSDALQYATKWGKTSYNLYLSDSDIVDTRYDISDYALSSSINVIDSNKIEIRCSLYESLDGYELGLAVYDGEFKYFDKVKNSEEDIIFTLNLDEINSDIFRLYLVGDAFTVCYDIEKDTVAEYWDLASTSGMSEIEYRHSAGLLESTLYAEGSCGYADSDLYKYSYKGELVTGKDKEQGKVINEYNNAVKTVLYDLTNNNKNIIDSKEDYELLKEWKKELAKTRVFEIEAGYDYLDRLQGKESTLDKNRTVPTLTPEEISAMPNLR